MTADLISLTIIALVSALCPIVANVIPRKLVPETVMLLLAGALLGPHGANVIWLTDSVSLLSELGLAFLFLLAGYEINPKSLMGSQGKRGLATWAISFVVAYVILSLAFEFPSDLEVVALTVALTTTALGTLLPILKERGLMGTRLGESVLAYGTWGELGPVLAMALLLSTRAGWKTIVILLIFAILCLIVAIVPTRSKRAGTRLYHFLTERADTTSQTMMRLTVLMLMMLVAFSALFDLDIVLGSFAAGFILRYVIPEGNHNLETKLDGIAYGFLIPLFFVVSGAKIDLTSVAQRPVLLVSFIVSLLIIRCLPVYIALSTGKDTRDMSQHNRATVALYCTTALPLIVAVTSVAVNAEVMTQSTAGVLVAAGAVTVFLMPLLASITYRMVGTNPPSDQRNHTDEPDSKY
ncbi:cation:proton antiporter [Adlercreutzia sp. ZJ138]|uniref:cation:proton antiporter n=1 Tax=Adlercreutzia sp. ZJ138 TaxID=2709405 RepID=UPI0013EAF481|nr:cation:proton antiporter [Adlercreutzia sp. ZJ138]